MKALLLLFSCILAIPGCARREEAPPPAEAALPPGWLGANSSGESPSPTAEKFARAAFAAYAGALPEPAAAVTTSDEHPWRLDGVIAEFGVTVGGFFGGLTGGSASVKATWRADRTPPAARAPRGLRFRSGQSAAELARMLEPVVRAAVASGAVQNESALRRNLLGQATRFSALGSVVERAGTLRGWRVDGLGLSLAFSADGDVSPVLGVGGEVSIGFYWAVRGSPAAGGGGGARAFLEGLVAALPAEGDLTELRRHGFRLSGIEIGVGVSVGGTIGIATASARVDGTLYLTRSGEAPAGPAISAAMGGIPQARLRAGMRRALGMGIWFARRARESETSRWKLSEIETEFSVQDSGEIDLATVERSGRLALVFGRDGT